MGCAAWGWQHLRLWDDHTWGTSPLPAKFPLRFRHYSAEFRLAKASALQTRTNLAAVKCIGYRGAKVKLKYISKCLQDQDLIQA